MNCTARRNVSTAGCWQQCVFSWEGRFPIQTGNPGK